MDQIKIGKFISKKRKEQNLTQQQLANKLNVTDRAISNWENGRRMPDISLFKPLCETLNITVNELINGETIPQKKVIETADEILIKTLKTTKSTKRKYENLLSILFILIILFTTLVISIVLKNKSIYPNINLYSIIVSLNENNSLLKKELKYKDNNKEYNIYYYGINSVELCNTKNHCYDLKDALKKKQTTTKKIKEYLDSQTSLGNIENYRLWDGGTSIYQNERYSIIYCNTLDGNKDIYFGHGTTFESLNGEYCGHEKNSTKDFIRTYHILKIEEIKEDPDFIFVTLKNNQNEVETVKLNKSNNLIVGNNYEFTFYAFSKFEDNIKNIFENCTIVSIKESYEDDSSQINEDIIINKIDNLSKEDNILKNIKTEIKKDSLSKTGATIIITDYNNYNIYGSDYRIDKKIDNNWQELAVIIKGNYAWNSIGYSKDKNNKLTFNINWENLYGELKPGEYRIVKSLYDQKNKENHHITVEFEIN